MFILSQFALLVPIFYYHFLSLLYDMISFAQKEYVLLDSCNGFSTLLTGIGLCEGYINGPIKCRSTA